MSAGSVLHDLKDIKEPIIACDLDDVLSATNQTVADWHNDAYGTNIDLSQFFYYYYWRNPGWGSPKETSRKVEEYYKTGRIDNALPIPDALDGVKRLKEMGFKLVVITARTIRERERSLVWVDRHFPGIFETVICTGQSQETTFADGHELITKLTKADVCKEIHAKVLIDDSAENAFKTATAPHPVTVLLFGNYRWNRRWAKLKSAAEELSHEEKNKVENGREWWRDDEFELPQPGLQIHRTQNWDAVVEWVRQAKADGHWE